MSALLYKILDARRFAARTTEGRLPPAPIDVRDGFVHLSDASQVRQTAQLHFLPPAGAPSPDLVLVAVRVDALTAGTLRWEPSRGGALFPHVYGDVPLAAIAWHAPLPLVDGTFAFPDTPARA
jgi:uncharacterized protein (DUF952 family)